MCWKKIWPIHGNELSSTLSMNVVDIREWLYAIRDAFDCDLICATAVADACEGWTQEVAEQLPARLSAQTDAGWKIATGLWFFFSRHHWTRAFLVGQEKFISKLGLKKRARISRGCDWWIFNAHPPCIQISITTW